MRLKCTVLKDGIGICGSGRQGRRISLEMTLSNRIGLDGDTPTIGENGNWWIGGKDTGVKAQGPQGEQGLQGDPFTYGDFTPEQIAELQKPATEAAGRADAAAASANESAAKANGAAEAADEAREGIQSDLAKKADKVVPTASGNLAGLTGEGNLEDSGIAPGSVARLDGEGELLADQVSPLQGRQTGVRTAEGYFSSAAPELLFEGDRSVEVLFRAPDSISGFMTIYNSVSNAVTGLLIRLSAVTKGISVVVGNVSFPAFPFEFGAEYHVVATVSGQSCRMYVNGVLHGSITPSSVAVSDVFLVGSYNTSESGNGLFTGVIRHVRLYNYALSDGEAEELWNEGRPGGYVVPEEMQGFDPDHNYSFMSPMTLDGWSTPDGTDIPPVIEDGAIKCAFNATAVASYKNGIFRNLGAFTRNKKVVLTVKLKSSVPGNRCTFGITGNNGASMYAATPVALSADWQEFTVEAVNNFAAILDSIVFYSRFNTAQEGFYYVKDVVVKEVGCIAEYLPCGLLPDRWRGTSGKGLDLMATGSPVLSYQPLPDQREVVIDTGVFYTDIASGVAGKSISVPEGYAVDTVVVKSYNGQSLTGVSVLNNYSDKYFIYNQDISMVGGRDTLVAPGVGLFDRIQYVQTYASSKATPVTVNATGNTTEGGMRVKVLCRWIGF